jgi:ribosomal protein L40E
MRQRDDSKAEQIRQYRDQGLTQTQTGKILGMHQTHISLIARRNNIFFFNRRDQHGENNSMFINGLGRSTIERLTRKIIEENNRSLYICERCNAKDPFGLEQVRHHKDRDRTNNINSNIEVLCRTCHRIEHNSDVKRGSDGRFHK